MKKILALLLAAALVLSLAACSGKTAKDDSKEKDTSSSSASETEKEEGGEDVSYLNGNDLTFTVAPSNTNRTLESVRAQINDVYTDLKEK